MEISAEMLRGDIRSIHSALEEVLHCARPDVPSWRFPGRLSAALSLDDVLAPPSAARQEEGEDGGRVVLLEAVVDRLLLLLQASLKLWSEAEERSSSRPIPLSLSSAVKKYCRQLLQRTRKTQSLQKQLAARDGEISSLTGALEKSQEQMQLLQSTLDQATSYSHFRPGSGLSSVVPYEARSTLRISRIQSSQSSRHSPCTNTDEPQPLATPLQTSVPSPRMMTNNTTSPECSTTTAVATQTAETSFAMCVRCSTTLSALTTTAGKLRELCQSLHQPSHLSDTNWEREAEGGTLDPEKWAKAVRNDFETIRETYQTKEDILEGLRETLARQRCQEEHLQLKFSQVAQEMSALQERAVERERAHARELAACREASSVRLKEVEGVLRSVQEHRDDLNDQLTGVRMERDKLIASSADIESQQQSLQSELLEVRERERALRGAQSVLRTQLERLEEELDQCRQQMETERVKLSKATSLHQTLQRKRQAGLSRQREVLERLEEMDRETEELRRELGATVRARDQLESRVEELETQCSSLHSQVAAHEEKSVESVRDQQKLSEELMDLELRLASLTAQLEKERENCRLLVTHPENSSGSGRDLQRHVSANTVRILLLEEQNTEMRETLVQKARQTKTTARSGRKLMEPVPLWHGSSLVSALLSQGKMSDSLLIKPPPLLTDIPSPGRVQAAASPASYH